MSDEEKNTFILRGGLHDGKQVTVRGIPPIIKIADPVDTSIPFSPDGPIGGMKYSIYECRTLRHGVQSWFEYTFTEHGGRP